ncbi:MAG: flavin prenyltransferase UbiX [Phycisphaerae bacterium]
MGTAARQIILGISGASGAAYARRLAQCILESGAHLHVVMTPLGRRVLAEELDIRRPDIAALTGRAALNATVYAHKDLGAKIASGSFLSDGMVICPCSSNTLGALANGLGSNLLTRAAGVVLKERRRLVIVHREMPVGAIEIENMLKLSRAGAVICPASPGFYMLPRSVEDLVDFVVGRVMDLLGIEHSLNTRWDPARAAERDGAADDE